jgi:hypothetical protein
MSVGIICQQAIVTCVELAHVMPVLNLKNSVTLELVVIVYPLNDREFSSAVYSYSAGKEIACFYGIR